MHCSLGGGNIIMRGGKALMKLNRDGITVFPDGVIPYEKTTYPEPEIRMCVTRDGALDHVASFLDCLRSRRQPNAPVNDAVNAANASHVGNLSYRSAKRLTPRDV